MKITYISAECTPFIKVGGLADVVGTLPQKVADLGARVSVILPLCEQILQKHKDDMKFLFYDFIKIGKRREYCGALYLKRGDVDYYFLDNEHYFKRAGIYGYSDDAERFSFFAMAAIALLPRLGEMPDVIHFNDWQAAIGATYLENFRKTDERFSKISTVLNIHNIEFQGDFDHNTLQNIFGLSEEFYEVLDYNGRLNFLKGAICLCDKVVTVSENYANEILVSEHSYGLHYILQENKHKLCGILNGIDTVKYDPAKDKKIVKNFSLENFSGKAVCKQHLQAKLKLEISEKVPIFALVARLERQKGVELLENSLRKILQGNVQVVVLGSGNPYYEELFIQTERENPGKMRTIIDFNEDLAHEIYAGADFFLMPSLSEPCGLAQMIAMRCATIPLVRAVGGLAETVEPYKATQKNGSGLTFKNFTSQDFEKTVNRALEIFNNKEDFVQIRKNAMNKDFSWEKSAKKYFEIYEKISEGLHE